MARGHDWRYFKVADRVVVDPGYYTGMTAGNCVRVDRPTRGMLLETWGVGSLRVQLDTGSVLYALPEDMRHVNLIEMLGELA